LEAPKNPVLATIAIRPEGRGGKQLDKGIGDDCKPRLQEEVHFAVIGFQD
jgi:hypothetical protein